MFPTDKTKKPQAVGKTVFADLMEPELRSTSAAQLQGTISPSSSSDGGMENVSYCEEDEAKLNPEVHVLGVEELPNQVS